MLVQVIFWILAIGAFFGIYEALRRREERRTGVKPPLQWWQLAAAVGCAVAAVVLGALLDI